MDVDSFITELLADLKANRLKLPTLPQIAMKVNEVIEDPKAEIKDLAQVIGTDPGLTARVIQVANSPMVRGSQTADNLRAAITRMGMTMVTNIVTTLLIRQLFQSRFPALRERMRLLWSHSSHVAAISHVLAKRYTRLKPDEAMLAGLVHDIGKLPIIAKAESYPKLATNEPALDGIIERLHPPLGKAILETWHFAPALTAVAAEHENLARDSERLDYTDLVIVANLHSYLGKEHPHAKADWSQVPALNKLGLDAEASVLMMEEAREEIRTIRKLLTE